MGIPKRTAAISGLILAGATAYTVGMAGPASADHSHHRNAQRIAIFNKNFNASKSISGQAQRQQQRQEDDERNFRFDRFKDH